MKEPKIALATSTLYHATHDIRFGLAMQTLYIAAIHGYTMVAYDNSPENVYQALKQVERYGDIRIFACSAELSMGHKRRLAIRAALDIAGPEGVGAYIDAEKYPMIPLLRKTAQPILRGEADLVIPGRTSLASYPRTQQLFEEAGNHFFAAYTGFRCDAWFGLRIFNAKAGELFCAYDGRHGDRWDAIFIPVIEAIAKGLRCRACEVDYVHPAAQTQAETGNIAMDEKRREQLNVLVEAIAKEAKQFGLSRH